jgi:hypothetical protein
MQSKSKILISLFYSFLFILALDYLFIYFFREWKFTKPIYYNLFWASHYSAIVGVIAFPIVYKYKKLRVGCLTTGCLLCFLIYLVQFNPIDTYEYPHDIKVISEKGNEKIVVREAKSGKTNHIRVDTVKVIDKFIFRKLTVK